MANLPSRKKETTKPTSSYYSCWFVPLFFIAQQFTRRPIDRAISKSCHPRNLKLKWVLFFAIPKLMVQRAGYLLGQPTRLANQQMLSMVTWHLPANHRLPKTVTWGNPKKMCSSIILSSEWMCCCCLIGQSHTIAYCTSARQKIRSSIYACVRDMPTLVLPERTLHTFR